MDNSILKQRTKKCALDIVKFTELLSDSRPGQTISYQLLRSGTSVAANYRAACRSRSKAEFISRISVVEEESDESLFWLELIKESGLIKENNFLDSLITEANELTAIFTATGKSSKSNHTGNRF